MPFGYFGQLFLVNLHQIFLLFLFGVKQLSLVILTFLPDLRCLLMESSLALLNSNPLVSLHLLVRFSNGLLALLFRFFEFVFIKLCHVIVLLHPALIFDLTLILGESEAFSPFLGFLLMSHFQFDFLVSDVLIELLDLEL